MSPRLTDWSIALATAIAFTTGIISLVSGHLGDWFIFTLHGVVGFWLLLLLWGKVRRVWPRLVHPRRWDRRTIYGLLALLIVALALVSGIWWVGGGELDFAGFNLLNWHITLGFVLTAAIVIHISHEHGYPLRLVAPGRRGFEWVKWITRVEVLTEPDPGEVVSIFTSSFTDAGLGK